MVNKDIGEERVLKTFDLWNKGEAGRFGIERDPSPARRRHTEESDGVTDDNDGGVAEESTGGRSLSPCLFSWIAVPPDLWPGTP